MNRIFLFSAAILCLLFSGCSSKSINSNQTIQQTCNANPVNNNESQEKQCCLIDTLETRIKHIEEICMLKDPEQSKDSACNTPSSSSYKAASSSFIVPPANNTKIHGQLDYKSKEIIDSREGCFGANCQVNNIHIENSNDFDFFIICKLIKDYLEKKGLLELISPYFYIPLGLGILLLIPAFTKREFFKKLIIVKILIYFFKQVFILLLERNYLKKIISFFKRFFKSIRTFIYTLKLTYFIKKTFYFLKENLFVYFSSYKTLLPIDNAKIATKTLSQLKFAILDDKKIKNIAITGPYGSGKSSVWLTFCKKYNVKKIKNVVEISLAKFNDPNKKEIKITNKNKLKIERAKELEIERAIIQQFIFSKKISDLKYSNFPRINNLTDIKTVFISTILFAFITLTLPLANKTILYISKEWLENPFKLETIYIPIILSLIYIFIFLAIQKINKLRISKICLKNIEITLGHNESLFNKYINEIVYFFEATKCNCVVIEDLDRFNSLKIFIKLREINALINNYPPTKNKVKFVYLVKDEMLPSSEEKTKFFDYIIPVIPALSISNSNVKLKESIQKADFPLDDEYIEIIHSYISDYRIMKNCINESIVYQGESSSQLLNKENNQAQINAKIFSLVLYKHLFPIDFFNLQKGKGVLFECLKNFRYTHSESDEDDNFINSHRLEYILKNYFEAKNQLLDFINSLNKKYEYSDENCVKAEYIIDLCYHGYINEDNFDFFFSRPGEFFLTDDEQKFIFNVSNNFPNSFHLSLEKDHLKEIIQRIKDYQWNSLGILNNNMIDYVLTFVTHRKTFYINNITEAMYSFDKMQPTDANVSSFFIPKYFIHCIIRRINADSILYGIANLINTTAYENESIKILTLFFKNTDTHIFLRFLQINDTKLLNEKYIEEFLNNNSFFLYCFFNENISNINFTYILEKNNIQVNLSHDLCKIFDDYKLYPTRLYLLNKKNLDLILEYNNLETNTPKYLTRCLSIKGLKKRFSESISDLYYNVIQELRIFDEDYITLKFIFSSTKLEEDNKQNLLDFTKKSWDLYALYCNYISFDNILANEIEKYFNDKTMEKSISNSLLNDENIIKKFIRSVILCTEFSSNNIIKGIISLFGNQLSILNCYEGEEKAISQLSKDKNEIIQEYAITHELNNLKNTMIPFIEANPTFFEKNFPKEEYSKESEFQLSILEKSSDKLKNIQKNFIDNIKECPDPDQEPRKFNTYKKVSTQLYTINDSIRANFKNIINKIKSILHDIQYLDLNKIDENTPRNAFTIQILLKNNIANTGNHWIDLLIEKITTYSLSITALLVQCTKEWNDKLSPKNQTIPDNQMKAEQELLCHKLEKMINELEDYISISGHS